jgi:RNA polymerase sigma-70 factor (ECF subfamily)
MDEPSDRVLVARMLRGDVDASAEFFEATFAPLFRFALPRVGGDAAVAEEIVQITLCRALRKLGTYRGEAALLTWLCAICRREIATWFGQQKRMPVMVDLTEDLPGIRAAIESLSAEQSAENNELRRLVQAVLDRLPARYGDALEWKYMEGLSVAEIAERLRVAPKAAESVLTRARVAFRDAFTAAYGGHWAARQA